MSIPALSLAHSTGEKVDFKKHLSHLYNPSAKEVALVDVPAMQFLEIDGTGDPNTSQDWQAAVEALFAVAYGLKFLLKKAQGADYVGMPLEGLWWTPDMGEFSIERKADWLWTMMIAQPQEVTADSFEQAREQAQRKKPSLALAALRLEAYHEGPAAQIMHIGSFATEGSTVARVHTFIQQHGYLLARKHHEIYLSDPRRAAPEKMRTVIRQPVALAV